MYTRFLPAYDTEEAVKCLPACRIITTIHEKMEVPGTFWIVGKLLESVEGPEYKALLGDNPLYEIDSHTYSHRMLAAHKLFHVPVWKDRGQEVRKSKDIIEQFFGCDCLGFRPAFGFDQGLGDDQELIDEVAAAGYRFVSSLLWGPETTLPALLVPPFTYTEKNHPELWELPGHGWHENALKATNMTDSPVRLLLFPMPWPEITPSRPISKPEEEFEINKKVIDRAIEMEMPYVSFIWHPWSLHQFDPAMNAVASTFQYVKDIGMEFSTFDREWKRAAEL